METNNKSMPVSKALQRHDGKCNLLEVGEKRKWATSDKSTVPNKTTLRKHWNPTQKSKLKSCVYSFIVRCYFHSLSLSCLNPEGLLWLSKQSDYAFFLLILCFDAQIWLSSKSQKVTPKAGHQSWHADVLGPFYICFCSSLGVWDLGLLESHSAHETTLADFICYYFFPRQRCGLRLGMIVTLSVHHTRKQL